MKVIDLCIHRLNFRRNNNEVRLYLYARSKCHVLMIIDTIFRHSLHCHYCEKYNFDTEGKFVYFTCERTKNFSILIIFKEFAIEYN